MNGNVLSLMPGNSVYRKYSYMHAQTYIYRTLFNVILAMGEGIQLQGHDGPIPVPVWDRGCHV